MTRQREERQLELDIRQLAPSYGKPDPLSAFPTPLARLAALGPAALSDNELLQTVLEAPSTQDHLLSSVELSRALDRLGGLSGLLGAHQTTLARELGPSAAHLVAALLELARRLAHSRMENRASLDHPTLVAEYILLRYANADQEVMGALYLDIRNRLLVEKELFRGTLSRAAVEPRPILKQALLRGATGIILFHTHPSGDPAPSVEDLDFTRRIADGGKLLGIRLEDHIIVGSGGRWVSLKRRGGW
jgi:DNA repair protein RadC